jgi:hypothetical protein
MEIHKDIADFHRRLVEEAPDGILAVDRDRVIRFWNGASRAPAGAALARFCGDDEDRPDALRRWRVVVRAGPAQGPDANFG